MEVFKFGGASVKDANGLKNVVQVLKRVPNKNLVIVVSAMGKTTNALEQVVQQCFISKEYTQQALEAVRNYHYSIVSDLHLKGEETLLRKIDTYFLSLENFLDQTISKNYNYVYDQVVSYGELLSSILLQHLLIDYNIPCTWVDVREVLQTNDTFREAEIQWEQTEQLVSSQFTATPMPMFYLTQGFIAATSSRDTTTLGREGSDYTAAIIGYCLNATRVTIWKDVPGVLSADPRYFQDAELLDQIDYNEAIELAFYGASVIHPKTLQPLQRKKIPLYVKSFMNPEAKGTVIKEGAGILPEVPCFILKKDQLLLRLAARDFSFILEEHLGEVFRLLSLYKIKVDLIQNSAISISLCVADPYNHIETLIEVLSQTFKTEIKHNVSLFTIRFFTETAVARIAQNHTVLLKQVSGNMAQLVIK